MLCVKCGRGDQYLSPKGKKIQSWCRKCITEKVRERQRKDRQLVLDHYGRECVCCGEKNELFLTVDHINNDGNTHRRIINKRYICTWLRLNNFPPIVQILCFNCNCGRQVNNGVCPHKILHT